MKVGDYVRFYNRSWTEIGQIAGEVEDSHLKVVKCRDGYYDLDNFIKSSPNIIDLIQVGDIVNDEKIVDIGCLTNGPEEGTKVIDYYIAPNTVYYFKNEEIKSIVTKEQFSCMEYKIGE